MISRALLCLKLVCLRPKRPVMVGPRLTNSETVAMQGIEDQGGTQSHKIQPMAKQRNESCLTLWWTKRPMSVQSEGYHRPAGHYEANEGPASSETVAMQGMRGQDADQASE